VRAINANSEPIEQLTADGATITVEGYPGLKADIALERPQNFRLRAQLLTSSELDIGSNEQLFWIWGKHQPGALLFARHADYTRGPARQLVPINPRWLIEALGVVQLNPQAEMVGPSPRGGGDLELLIRERNEQGEPIERMLVVDGTYGWVLEQHLKDAQGNLLASVEASEHRFYPDLGISLPDEVRVQIAPGEPSQFVFRVNVDRYQINQLGEANKDLWAIPEFPGFEVVDLGDPRVAPPEMRSRIEPANLKVQPEEPRTGYYRPAFRGYAKRR
jgi:hypothetical protein